MDVSTFPSSVVKSSSDVGGDSVVGRLNRLTLELTGRNPLDDDRVDRTLGRLEVKVPGRRIDRPKLLRPEETTDDTKLENLLVVPDDKTGLGVMESSEETRERKSPRDPSTDGVLD